MTRPSTSPSILSENTRFRWSAPSRQAVASRSDRFPIRGRPSIRKTCWPPKARIGRLTGARTSASCSRSRFLCNAEELNDYKLLKVLLVAMIAMVPFTLAVNSVRAETAPTVSQSAGATKIDRSKLLLGPRDSASTPALTQDPAGWIMGKQQQFYRSMSLAIRDIGRGNQVAARSP